ncbi:MAG: DUF1559 domain-containing protein [Planctomycetaceae bacterium]|nr:DUF1559 domain-containing protein [Planctomycetaceae bacterium]
MQAAREAARRAQCTNKLKQLALSTHNYHDVHNALPAGHHNNPWCRTSVKTDNNGGLPSIFPYLEMESQYEELKSCYMAQPEHKEVTTLGTVQTAVLTAFLCPSSAGSGNRPSNWTTRTNYRLCEGDNAQHHWLNRDSTTPARSGPDNYHRGCFGYLSWYNFAAITDGTSNTLFFSEREMPDSPTTPFATSVLTHVPTWKVKSDILADYPGVYGGSATTASPSYLLDRSACLNTVGTNGMYQSTSAATTAIRAYHSTLWNGPGFDTAFNTITPPNGPSCTRTGNAGYMVAPSSNHSGGVNAALGDGAVRFISDTINIGTANKFDGNVTAIGPSPFGVWGALGSRNGGESTTL